MLHFYYDRQEQILTPGKSINTIGKQSIDLKLNHLKPPMPKLGEYT